MLTISVTDDLDLSQYDPEQLLTARLQRPFLLDDDEAETLNVKLQQAAEEDLRSRLTNEQRQRRREFLAAQARAEFNQYKQLVDNMGDPAEMQAKITAMLHKNPVRDMTEKILNRQTPSVTDYEQPRPSGFTDEQLKALGATGAKPKRKHKSDKTQKQLDSLIEIQTEHRHVLKTNAQVMDDQLTELRTANTTLKSQLKHAEADAKGARTFAVWSIVIAGISLLTAIGTIIVQAVTAP